jgi:hypothetical protein
MITETDRTLAASFFKSKKKDPTTTKAIDATAKAIAEAMLPERTALMALVSRITEVQTDPSFKAVFAKAKEHQVIFTGLPWKPELDAARAIVDAWPTPEPEPLAEVE